MWTCVFFFSSMESESRREIHISLLASQSGSDKNKNKKIPSELVPGK